jgi:hypothetical protein
VALGKSSARVTCGCAASHAAVEGASEPPAHRGHHWLLLGKVEERLWDSSELCLACRSGSMSALPVWPQGRPLTPDPPPPGPPFKCAHLWTSRWTGAIGSHRRGRSPVHFHAASIKLRPGSSCKATGGLQPGAFVLNRTRSALCSPRAPPTHPVIAHAVQVVRPSPRVRTTCLHHLVTSGPQAPA